MKLIDKIKNWFSGKPAAETASQPQVRETAKIKRTCKGCSKTFSIDPSWEFIPNYCKECKQKFAREKEEKQRAGSRRQIRRKCRNCGKFFTFPNTLPHYPNYCSNCRKAHQAAMKEKYGRPVNRKTKQDAGNR